MLRWMIIGACLALAACAQADRVERLDPLPLHQGETPELRVLINRYADHYEVPRALVHRVVQRESRYTPSARNGPYMGLMQIHPTTARTMGHRGSPADLLNPETNLRYAVKYLRGAWMVSDGSFDKAVGWYARGYYYEAKRRGLLEATGLR
jgi:soluble lytic murein transglycosylase-like protein